MITLANSNFVPRPTARRSRAWPLLAACCLFLLGFPCRAADTLTWNTNKNRVSADIHASPLLDVLEGIAGATGWHVFVEPETLHTVSAKFDNQPPTEALRILLGDVNFALLPNPTNKSSSRLFVFRTGRQNATQAVHAKAESKPKVIPNELIVRLKPGAKIDELAKLLGAKVIGRIDGLNAYRLRFDDEAATDSARGQLSSNSDVASVDNNYTLDPLPSPQAMQSGPSAGAPNLQMKAPPDSGRVIVGLVDTAVQPLGNNLDQFVLKQVSVAGDPQLDPNTPSHGTSMLETLLNSLQHVTGGSTSVQVLPVDVFGPNATTSTFDVANGIVQAVNGGAKVINLSLGSSGDSPFLRDVVNNALSQNIMIIASAGNTGDTSVVYPAGYSGVNPVTALSDPNHIASYADHGSWINLGAPGTSLVPYNNQTWAVTGTSPAAAFTSGAAAGAMDSKHFTTAQAQTFIQRNFGITIPAGQ